MIFPNDVFLPENASYFCLVDNKNKYNPHWDVVWSFTYALSGSHQALCTFLTTSSFPISAYPGHYLSYLNKTNKPNGSLAIAFDTSGLFALSSTSVSGVSLENIKPNSLIIRNNEKLLYNEYLSDLDPNFILSEPTKEYKTLRFRLSNGGKKLYIDYKLDKEKFKTLLELPLSSFNLEDNPHIFPAISYTSPVSSSSTNNSKLWLKNFHIQGNINDPTYEVVPYEPISAYNISKYTILSSIRI
jgi:hypothetical protein